jgi:8-oxo-dGTP diphosphatase
VTPLDGYLKPAVTVDLVIFTVQGPELQVLLIKRRDAPFEGAWALPGGFVRINESLDEAAKRLLREKVGVADVYLEQLYTFGHPGRDPRGRVITVAYFALVDAGKLRLAPERGVEDIQWHSMFALPGNLAFDHKTILEYALTRLQYKLEYTTVGFQLLPKEFTLTDLQQIYQAVLRRQLDKRNFRKSVMGLRLIEPLQKRRRDGAHRPARLYRFKSKAFILPRDVV